MAFRLKSRIERDGASFARRLAGLFDDIHPLVSTLAGDIDREHFSDTWNAAMDDLKKMASSIDALGAMTLSPADPRFPNQFCYRVFVPQMKICVNLELMGLKLALDPRDLDDAVLAKEAIDGAIEHFAGLVLAVRDAPYVHKATFEAIELMINGTTRQFEAKVLPIFERAREQIRQREGDSP